MLSGLTAQGALVGIPAYEMIALNNRCEIVEALHIPHNL